MQRVFKDKPPRLDLIFRRSNAPVHFVTFNTHIRATVLATAEVHGAFIEYYRRAGEFRIGVGRYVLMPDHIHLFVRGSLDFVLAQWVRILKRSLSAAIPETTPHWQSGFFDHLIRHSESYAEKWEYVCRNPVRAGFVKDCQEWPWQGEIERLEA